jgi:LCP family protein required for cell wall assembly
VRRRGWRAWARPKRILGILACLLVLIVVAGVVEYFNVSSKLTKTDVLVPTSLTSAGTNWLITGSDSRAGLNRQEENQLALGHDIAGSRSDTIMLLHLPANGTRPTLVSLPRDSYVPIPGYGYNKLNAAYDFGGPKLLIKTVQNVTGLPINHYMGIGFGGLVTVVNDVGGVQMCLKAPMKDPKAGLNLKAGCQTLSGDQALGFVRTRAFGEGDLQREQDQRVLLKGILSKMTSAGTLANPLAIVPAANGAASAITVDQGTGLSSLISVAFALRNPVTTTVPFGQFANTNVGSVVEWNIAAAKQFFYDLAHDQPLPKNLVTGSSVQGTV